MSSQSWGTGTIHLFPIFSKYDNPSDKHDPMEWTHLDMIRKKVLWKKIAQAGRIYSAPLPIRRRSRAWLIYNSVNYNKPNDYTIRPFGTGCAKTSTNQESVIIDLLQPFDFEYWTHLDIAKQRLESVFDVIPSWYRNAPKGSDNWTDRWFGKNETGSPYQKTETEKQGMLKTTLAYPWISPGKNYIDTMD